MKARKKNMTKQIKEEVERAIKEQMKAAKVSLTPRDNDRR